jgi:hypothetical protein
MKKKWVVLISQMVLGKSKAPERTKPGYAKWVRHKPYNYSNSWKDHEILYTRSFTATEEDANTEAQRINAAMFDTYVMGMGKTDVVCIKEFTVSLHNCTDDVTYNIGGTIYPEGNKLWSHRSTSVISNKRMIDWGVISTDPSTASYQILISKERDFGSNI